MYKALKIRTSTMKSSEISELFPVLSYLLQHYQFLLWGLVCSMVCILVIEVGFYLLIRLYVVPKLNKNQSYMNKHRNLCPTVVGSDIMRILLELKDVYSIHSFLKGFFLNIKDVHDIKHDNIKSFLAWSLYNLSLDALTVTEHGEIDSFITNMENKFNIKFEEGYNASISHVKMTLEDIPYIHRPLILYVFAGLMEILSNFVLLKCLGGFTHLEIDNTKYWFRSCNNDKPPIILFHGITSGWVFYIRFVYTIAERRSIILIDVDAIKVKSLNFHFPNAEQVTSIVEKILQRHQYSKASIIGHSFGSILAAWVIKSRPDIVSHITLLDPVSILLCLPDVAYNFIYRKPSTIVQFLIYFCASRELTISNLLHRNFIWHNNLLDLHSLPSNVPVIVGLSGNDEVLNSPVVSKYIDIVNRKRENDKLYPITTLYFNQFSHGQCLVSSSALNTIKDALYSSEKLTRKHVHFNF